MQVEIQHEPAPVRVFVVWHPRFPQGEDAFLALYEWLGGPGHDLYRRGLGVPLSKRRKKRPRAGRPTVLLSVSDPPAIDLAHNGCRRIHLDDAAVRIARRLLLAMALDAGIAVYAAAAAADPGWDPNQPTGRVGKGHSALRDDSIPDLQCIKRRP